MDPLKNNIAYFSKKKVLKNAIYENSSAHAFKIFAEHAKYAEPKYLHKILDYTIYMHATQGFDLQEFYFSWIIWSLKKILSNVCK